MCSYVVLYVCTQCLNNTCSYIHILYNIHAADSTLSFNDTYFLEEKVTLLESDVFFNCLINYDSNVTVWTLDGELVWINETSKYNVNASGLIVYNVTAEDEGNYTCHVHDLTANTFLHVASM